MTISCHPIQVYVVCVCRLHLDDEFDAIVTPPYPIETGLPPTSAIQSRLRIELKPPPHLINYVLEGKAVRFEWIFKTLTSETLELRNIYLPKKGAQLKRAL